MSASRLPPTAAALAAAAVFILAMVVAYPYRDVFAFDTDEGVNAMKALLLSRGAHLYAGMWNDQPPLFPHLLRLWCGAVGWTIGDARLLVLGFGGALVFALYDIARLESGHRAACLAALAFVASAYGPRLSASLMIGLPAIALATLAIWALFRWLHGGRDGWLLLSGALLGASLATKLFTAFLLPVGAVWLLAMAPAARRWTALCTWLAATLATLAALLLSLVGIARLPQLVATHLAARSAPALQQWGGGGLLVTSSHDWLLTALGWAAFARLAWQRRARLSIFPAWAMGAVVVLLTHHPVWYHHALLLSVSYCPAIGVALAEAIAAAHLRRPRPTRAWRVALLTAGALLVLRAVDHLVRTPATVDGGERALVEALRTHLGPRRIVVASDVMYAFRAGATVPANTAVLSVKRAATDAQLEAAIAAAFVDDNPEAVLIRATAQPRTAAAIRLGMADRYVEVLRAPAPSAASLSVRRDLLPAGGEARR